jgi:uncharacterized protein
VKLILLLVVLGVAAWLLIGRRRRRPGPPPGPAETGPEPMLACARCGLHLPQAEALTDSRGLRYCCEAHRLAGPP